MNPEKPKNRREAVLPVGKSVEELLVSPDEEMAKNAAEAGVSIEKYKELLARALERKNEALEAAIAAREHVVEPIDRRAERIRSEILAEIKKLDFFSMSKIPGSYDEIEDKAFSFLNQIEGERNEQKRKALSSSASAYFFESTRAYAGLRATELMREGKTQREALVDVANELSERARGSNVKEQAEALSEVAHIVRWRSYDTEMYETLDDLRQAYESGSPTEEQEALMRKLMLAARGGYVNSYLGERSRELYEVQKYGPILDTLGKAYKRAAGFDLEQNEGALGSIEKFDIDLPSAYTADGSPRSRPRRSSIPEERH